MSSVLIVRAILVGLGGLLFLKINMSGCLLVSLVSFFAFSGSWVTFQGEFFGGFLQCRGKKITQRLRSLCNPLCSYWEFRQSMDHDDS